MRQATPWLSGTRRRAVVHDENASADSTPHKRLSGPTSGDWMKTQKMEEEHVGDEVACISFSLQLPCACSQRVDRCQTLEEKSGNSREALLG